MTYEIIKHAPAFEDSFLEAYTHKITPEMPIDKRKAMIVCPGGGYRFLSEREAEPIALQYFAAGLNVFTLRYSINEKAINHAPLIEACLAVKYLRDHADELHVDPDHVFITGFSAGGHLAAWCGTMWHSPEVAAHLGGADPIICKPTATLPCYAVITSKPYRHKGSFIVLNGEVDDEAGMARFSLDELVDERTAPAFLWHTAEDGTVPVQNSIYYAEKLANYKIPFELHIYPNGPHGLSLANKETWVNNKAYDIPYVADWINLALRWVLECPFEK